MSILMLKIFHMKEQTVRKDVGPEHVNACETINYKIIILMEQKRDMQLAYDELLEDIGTGMRKFKVYRQMKMYNEDKSLNPKLYETKSSA